MNDKQQTAVEWLIQRIYMSDFEIYNFMKENGDFEQAKEMDKEQKIEAYIAGSLTGCGCYDYMKKEDGEEYYNKIYGGNK